MAGWFLRVAGIDARVIRPGEASGSHGDPSGHSLLYEEVLALVREQLQLYPRLFQQSVPRKVGARIVLGRVKAVLLHSRLPEGLKDVSQQEYVCPAVEIAVVTEVLAPEGFPYLLCMGMVLFGNVLVGELVVETLLGG